MSQEKNPILEVLSVVESSEKKIGEILKEDPTTLRLLTGRFSVIKNMLKQNSAVQDRPKGKAQPMTSFMGKKIEVAPLAKGKIIDAPKKEEVASLKERVGKLRGEFLGMNDTDIKNVISEVELRALGKSVGLDVTPTKPDVLDATFYAQIREALAAPKKDVKGVETKEAALEANSDKKSSSKPNAKKKSNAKK